MIEIKYKGRTFSNGQSLAKAMTRDMKQQIERNVRQAAALGVRVRKAHKGLKIEGDTEHMECFQKRLGK